MFDDPPDVATFIAHLETGRGMGLDKPPADSRIVRINPLIRPVKSDGEWTAPSGMNQADFTYLVGLDMDAVEQQQVDAICRYADLWLQDLALNQPIRWNRDSQREVGQDRFSDALAAWRALCAPMSGKTSG